MANGFLTSSPTSRHGDSLVNGVANRSVGCKFTCPGTGVREVTEIGAWVSADAAASFRLAIFTHDAANNNPDALVDNSTSAELSHSSGTVTKKSHTYAAGAKPLVTGGQVYWLCVIYADANLNFDYLSGGSGTIVFTDATAYPTFPTPAQWDAGTEFAEDDGIYAVLSSTEFFGQLTGTSDDNSGGQDQFSWYSGKSFQCPGSPGDTVTIKELSAYVQNGGSAGKIRIGIYDSDGNLVCQGTAQVSFSGTFSWQGHLAQADMTPNPCTLVGGDYYRLAMYTPNDDRVNFKYQAGSSGDVKYTVTNYDSGLPSSFPAGTNWSGWWMIRCGVEVTAGALEISAQDSCSASESRSIEEGLQYFGQTTTSGTESTYGPRSRGATIAPSSLGPVPVPGR